MANVEMLPAVSEQFWTSYMDQSEIAYLSSRYGAPVHRCYNIRADEHLWSRRWRPMPDRRGEVVFAVQLPGGEVLLHTKHNYYPPIFRLLSGGIEIGESVEQALFREIKEETGLDVIVDRFIGLLVCHFHHRGSSTSFVSYVFHLHSQDGKLRGSDAYEVAAYRSVPAKQLRQIGAGLRSLTGPRRCWGLWRSIAHDVVYDAICQRTVLPETP